MGHLSHRWRCLVTWHQNNHRSQREHLITSWIFWASHWDERLSACVKEYDPHPPRHHQHPILLFICPLILLPRFPLLSSPKEEKVEESYYKSYLILPSMLLAFNLGSLLMNFPLFSPSPFFSWLMYCARACLSLWFWSTLALTCLIDSSSAATRFPDIPVVLPVALTSLCDITFGVLESLSRL